MAYKTPDDVKMDGDFLERLHWPAEWLKDFAYHIGGGDEGIKWNCWIRDCTWDKEAHALTFPGSFYRDFTAEQWRGQLLEFFNGKPPRMLFNSALHRGRAKSRYQYA